MTRMGFRACAALVSLASLAGLAGCATQPEPAGGDVGLPTANSGPFRVLAKGEIGNLRSPPNGLTDTRGYGRDMAVLDLDGKPETLAVVGYVAASIKENNVKPEPDSPTKVIHRYGALDGRSFDREQLVVLEPSAAWEGGIVEGPSVLRVDGEVWLYYAAAGGIGLARGNADGTAFTKEPEAVLGPAGGGWEAGIAPRSPGVVRLANGTFRMFYEVALPGGGSAIGEAGSADGLRFERIGEAPALSPSTAAATDGGDPPYDSGGVGGPYPMLSKAGDGEAVLRVYYGATDGQGKRTIGLAARYGNDEALQRAVAPVFGTSKPGNPREPCVVVFKDFTFVYATAEASNSDEDPAVAVGVAPATAKLPPPDPM